MLWLTRSVVEQLIKCLQISRILASKRFDTPIPLSFWPHSETRGSHSGWGWDHSIPATSKRQFFGRFCQTVKIFDDLRKNWRFRQKLPIGPSSLACPNKSIYLFYALSKDQMQSWKASIATNASPPIASVLDRTAPSANKCFSFSFSLAEYLFVSSARRLNRGHMCLC